MHVCLLFVFQYMTAAAAAAPMQGTYIPQYTPVPPTAVPVEVRPSLIKSVDAYPEEDIITANSHKPLPFFTTRPARCINRQITHKAYFKWLSVFPNKWSCSNGK